MVTIVKLKKKMISYSNDIIAVMAVDNLPCELPKDLLKILESI